MTPDQSIGAAQQCGGPFGVNGAAPGAIALFPSWLWTSDQKSPRNLPEESAIRSEHRPSVLACL